MLWNCSVTTPASTQYFWRKNQRYMLLKKFHYHFQYTRRIPPQHKIWPGCEPQRKFILVLLGASFFLIELLFNKHASARFVYDTLGTTINNLLQDIREMLSLWWEVRAALNLSLRCFTFVDAITQRDLLALCSPHSFDQFWKKYY